METADRGIIGDEVSPRNCSNGERMVKTADEKILRLGVVRNGTILEERLLRKKQDVTVGNGSKNLIPLPNAGLPDSVKLFSVGRNGLMTLEVDESMEGRIVLDGKVRKLKEVVASDSVARKSGKFLIPLSGESRGKVVIGDVTFLYQFVTLPIKYPDHSYQHTRGGVLSTLDLFLTATLLLSFVLQGGFAGGLHFWWEKTGKYQVVERAQDNRLLAALVVEVEEVEEVAPTEEKEEEKEEEVAEEETRPEPEPVAAPKPEKKKPVVARRNPSRSRRKRLLSGSGKKLLMQRF